jgi:ketosteroid isomerase-like protein
MIKSIILTLLVLCNLAFCDTLEQDKQALRDLKTLYETSVKSGDLSPLKPHLADNFSAIMITGEIVNSYTELDAFWKKSLSYLGDDAEYTVTINPDDSIFIDNIALSSGSSVDQITGSTNLSFTTTWSSVAQKQADGSWKLLRIQVTTHPIDNPFSEAFYQWKTILYACGAGLLALLIGYFIGKRKKKQSV